jgi:hypothetical protein
MTTKSPESPQIRALEEMQMLGVDTKRPPSLLLTKQHGCYSYPGLKDLRPDAESHQVILALVAVMANGGAFAPSGHAMIAVAAKDYSALIICLNTSPFIMPLFPHIQAVAKASRISPAVWSYSCNNCIGYGSSSSSNTIGRIYLQKQAGASREQLTSLKNSRKEENFRSEEKTLEKDEEDLEELL